MTYVRHYLCHPCTRGRYNVIAVCGHMGALFVLSYPLVLSVWLNKDSFKPVAKFYYWAFWFGWLDFAFSMGTALSYGGSSFNTTRVLYFSLGVVLSLALWVLPLLTSLPEGLRGAALQVRDAARRVAAHVSPTS